MLNQSYHQDEYLDSYLISSFEIDDIDIDLADYADQTNPYANDLENKKVIQKNLGNNFLQANPGKCQLLINTNENVTSKIQNATITKKF